MIRLTLVKKLFKIFRFSFLIIIYLHLKSLGTHLVCAQVTDEFLEYTKKQGNDLITPNAAFDFPGLKAGDSWCLCVLRWYQAYKTGIEMKLNLGATHYDAIQILKDNFQVSLNDLKKL
jgi:uncharacterized protein (DUF2237 family)